MTVIFSDHGDNDCLLLSSMWRGIDANVIHIRLGDNGWQEVVDATIAKEEDTLILAGHGTSHGLLSPNFMEYVIHEGNVRLIHAKRVICFWCHASEFCERNGLRAFSTSMFISNTEEAVANHCKHTDAESIDEANMAIYNDMRRLIAEDTNIERWASIMWNRINVRNEVDVFNRQGMRWNI